MKFRDILKSASTNLMRNKGRTVLTIIAIFIGAFTIALTTGVNIGVNDYIDKQVGSVGGANQLFIRPKMEMNVGNGTEPSKYNPEKKTSTIQQQSMLAEKDIEKIKKISDVTSVEPMKSVAIDYIKGADKHKYVFSATSALDEMTIDLAAGRKVSQTSQDFEINLSPEYVKALGYTSSKAAVGETVQLGISSSLKGQEQVIEAKIVGVRNASVIQNGLSLMNKALIDKVVSINQADLPEHLKNQYAMIIAEVKKDSTPEQIKDIKKDLDKAGYLATTVEDEIGMIRNIINAITGVLTMFGAIALLAASFGIINTLYMSVQERTREIGLMKAMGLSNGKVFTIFSVEAALIGFFGSILGILGAVGVGNLVNRLATDSFLKALTGFKLIQFSLPSSLTIILVIMFIAFLAGTLPARRAAKLDPIESLRYE
ncbi:permease [Enterococcus faecalis]|jgi:putative ABC transport system permease protein|uniref:ABC transporter permease n=1 Tax=Enterococcus TaxID=1350 RepID=UPI000CF2A665|nr:ABC transporter permease [Enterococcus faecalis]EIT2191969.1 ABC transporter permease [Enterococcus faecalis]EIY5962392.1 ABC transporter permease [Enterococcus faecalis]EKZ0174283.1 ABC transporter permease [Enterococcus faecalis]MBP4069966.1 ABC transporter permease [Enterococcus faecalis]MBP4098911.1 ABC transporter permease [Enterococcus faecalis]